MHTEYDEEQMLFTVALYGPQTRLSQEELTAQLGANPELVYLLRSASDATKLGFREIWTPYSDSSSDEFDAFADAGFITEPKQAIMHFTADCPVIVAYDKKHHQLIATHAGRPAMSPSNEKGEPISNIVTDCWQAFDADPTNVIVKILGSIAPKDFKHDLPEARKLIEPFEQFGEYAFHDYTLGTLDLAAITTEQFVGFGVPREQIQVVGPYTSEVDWLTSYRYATTPEEKLLRNRIVAVLQDR
ncbi:laccase domain-containing protein [Candidatus Kaiserbacteria bacterium]|nr:laccase domain-containing protein [Candidatus Kaiserbacteria bacterium]